MSHSFRAIEGGILELRTCRKGWGAREDLLAFPLVSVCVILHSCKASEAYEAEKSNGHLHFFRDRKHRPREAELLAQGCTGISKNINILPTVLLFLYKFDKCISPSRADQDRSPGGVRNPCVGHRLAGRHLESRCSAFL